MVSLPLMPRPDMIACPRRRSWYGQWILMLALFFLPASWIAAQEDTVDGRIVAVEDGNTVTVESAHSFIRIRLADIDAPQRGQPYSREARQALHDLLIGQPVHALANRVDAYGRLIGMVYVNGKDVARSMLQRGLAWVRLNATQDPLLLKLQAAARTAHLGLWADPNPVPPWQFRSESRAPRAYRGGLGRDRSTRPERN